MKKSVTITMLRVTAPRGWLNKRLTLHNRLPGNFVS